MKTLVVALGGNALLQRGEALTAENQYRNIADAVPALALLLEPDMPPVTAVLTRIKVSADDPAFLEPEKFIGPVYSPEEQMALEATYGWHMKRDGKYLRRVVASPAPRQIIESAAIELLLKEGHVVICSGGGGVPVAGEGEGVEAVIDKDLAAALLAEQIGYVKRCGKPAWIGALSRIDDTLAGRAGTCICL